MSDKTQAVLEQLIAEAHEAHDFEAEHELITLKLEDE